MMNHECVSLCFCFFCIYSISEGDVNRFIIFSMYLYNNIICFTCKNVHVHSTRKYDLFDMTWHAPCGWFINMVDLSLCLSFVPHILTSPSASYVFIIVLRNQPGFSFKHILNTNTQHNRQESRYLCFVPSCLPFSQGKIISLHIRHLLVFFLCSSSFPLHLTFVSYSFSHVFTTLWFSIGLLFDSIANRIAAGADFEACQSHKYRFLALFLSQCNVQIHFFLSKIMKNSLYPLLFCLFNFGSNFILHFISSLSIFHSYCVEFRCCMGKKLVFFFSTEAYFNHAIITACRLVRVG